MENELAGKIQTVLGPIEPGNLGITLTHEHLLVDLTVAHGPPISASDIGFYREPVSQETWGRIRYYGAQNEDNAQ